MFRRSLMSSVAQIFRAPEDDRGHADASDFDPLSDFTDPDEQDDEDDDQGGEGFDDEDDGDAGGDDDNNDDEDGPPARRAKPESRAEKRLRALAADNAELKRRLDGLTTPSSPAGPSQAELERQEAQHLATLTAEERVQYMLEKQNRNTTAALQGLQFQIADTADRSAFEALCRTKPALAKLAAKVESTLADMRKGGSTAPRETVAAYLLGQAVLNGKSNAPKQRREAAENRDRQQARPGSGRSDARSAPAKGTDRDARRKRLEGQFI